MHNTPSFPKENNWKALYSAMFSGIVHTVQKRTAIFAPENGKTVVGTVLMTAPTTVLSSSSVNSVLVLPTLLSFQ